MANIEKRVKMMMLDRLTRIQQERQTFDALAEYCDNLKKVGVCDANKSRLCDLTTCPHAKS